MARASELARALVSRRWLWVTLVVLALMAVLARLGIWQLDRLDQRRAANTELLEAIESAPLDLNAEFEHYAGMTPAEVASDLANRDVVMTGSYDYANQRILKLQNWEGRAGVHLITPFMPDGADGAVLIDRGWIPDAEYTAGHAYDEATGPQTVTGYVALTETISRRVPEAVVPVSPGLEVFRIDIAAIQEEMPFSLLPFYLKLEPPESGSTELPITTAKEVDLSEGPHLSYAMQWFIFSIGLGIGYVVYVNRWLTMRDGARPSARPTELSSHK